MQESDMEVRVPEDIAAKVCPFTGGDGVCNLLTWMVNHGSRAGGSNVLCPPPGQKHRRAPDECPLKTGAVDVRLA